MTDKMCVKMCVIALLLKMQCESLPNQMKKMQQRRNLIT